MMIWAFVLLIVVVLLVSARILQPRLLAKSKGVPSRTEVLQGKTGVVTEAIDPNRGTGRVRVAGQDWAAQSHAPLPIGTFIRVKGADGIILNVLPSENDVISTKGHS
jgi:membrane protein implicated in regulation of membrane protease activity